MQKKFDLWLFLPIIGLSVFSLFTILGTKKELFANQLFFFTIGYILFFLFFFVGYNFFRLNSRISYFIFIVLLILTFIFGSLIRGSRRWIDFYFFQFQPSEFFKVIFLIYLSDIMAKRQIGKSRKWWMFFGYFLIPTLIIFKQPDLGNAIIYTVAFFSLLYLAGYSIKNFVFITLTGIICLPFFWQLLKDYQKNRIISFINPEIDTQGIAYNLIQSVITVGSGGLLGRGLGLGTQARYLFLPEYHTDFAFASLVEQFGLLGGLVVIFCYAILIFRLITKAESKRDSKFSYIFLYGSVFMLLASIIINIGMNLGLLPITGIALPLISYGGSSIVSTMILLGLILSI